MNGWSADRLDVTRRTVLAGVGTGLAGAGSGCLGLLGGATGLLGVRVRNFTSVERRPRIRVSLDGAAESTLDESAILEAADGTPWPERRWRAAEDVPDGMPYLVRVDLENAMFETSDRADCIGHNDGDEYGQNHNRQELVEITIESSTHVDILPDNCGNSA